MHRLVPALGLLAASCVSEPLDLAHMPVTIPRMGTELRVYPTGAIFTGQHLYPAGENDAWLLEVGLNVTDRDDDGEHEEEDGYGIGIGAGWRRYASEGRLGFFWGGRANLWDMEIDWDDPARRGTSTVLVFQPTVEVGHAWSLGGAWILEAGLSAGAEVNLDTDGEDVGEGGIVLGGIGLSAGF